MAMVAELTPPHTLTFSGALEQAEVLARQALPPEMYARISCGVALVREGKVMQVDAGHWEVASATTVGQVYGVNGSCGCADAFYRAPKGLCKHRLATYLARKSLELIEESQTPAALDVPVEVETSAAPVPEAPHGIDPRHMVLIQGRPFIKFAGLLDLAHKRGLQSLKVDWTYNDAELSLAHAVAVFPFGTFEESGDSTPANVNRKVAPHFRRCALTRSAARCLRLALGVDLVAVEELAED